MMIWHSNKQKPSEAKTRVFALSGDGRRGVNASAALALAA
jgi:hypothetical protein